MRSPADGELLDAYRSGNPEAFEELVGRHEAPLLRHARSLVGDWGAEDAVQEAFLALARRPPELPADTESDGDKEGRQHRALAAWLHRVTRNACMDLMRSEDRRHEREHAAAAREATAGGLDEVEGRDTRLAVERGLDRLPEDQREVLVLRILGDRSYQEIADITGRKVGTVGWLISVGLKALSHELAPLLGGASTPVPISAPAEGNRS